MLFVSNKQTSMLCLFSVIFCGIGLYLLYEWIMRQVWLSGIPGRYIFITGCDTGFGHELAKHLDLLGCKVFAGCLTEDGCKRLTEKCSERLTIVQLDVTSTESVKKAADFVKSRIPESEGTCITCNFNSQLSFGRTIYQ